ncbi:tandem-95 repeat protein [Endozoicomonas atrinae]|uniref:tandem-95 repeat protein n=1 Tax=Endozoicomonas atrinae TaxID=1333660 RepID=UPI003B00F9F3
MVLGRELKLTERSPEMCSNTKFDYNSYNGDGTFSYTPAEGFVGADQFSYQITDGTNVTTGTIDVVVSDNASVTIDEGAFQVDLGAELVDTDGSETLEVTISGIPEGALVSDGTNSITLSGSDQVVDVSTWDINNLLITPSENYFGNFNVNVNATSSEATGSRSISSSSLTVYVLSVADAPVAGDVTIWQVVDNVNTGSFLLTADQLLANSEDLDGDNLTVQEVSYSGLDGLLTSVGEGVWQFEQNDNYGGSARFSFTVTDGELTDTAEATLNTQSGSSAMTGTEGVDVLLGSSEANNISGGAGNDTLIGGAGDDIVFGGAGNDKMSGGEGSDTFLWIASDLGNTNQPAEDLITDFQAGPGGDVLDLSDLLDETEPLDDYLSLNFEDSDTILEVKPDAEDVSQRITLKGVNLAGSGASDIEILNNLIDDGNLLV